MKAMTKAKRFDGLRLKGACVFLVIACMFFVLFSECLNDPFFDSDEGDIYANGIALANGYHLYSEVSSQHMPFSYYISSVFWRLGAQSVVGQRIAFYIFFAILWTFLFTRYKTELGRFALLIYPFLFVFSLRLYDWGTAILSEHLAGLGFVILALEFLRFCKTRTLRADNCMLISFAIVLTFGTIFIAAYGVAAVALFVLIKEIQWKLQENIPGGEWLKDGLKLLGKLTFWCVLPWAVLLIHYAASGTLGDAVYYAYTFNRTVYAQYLGGYGSDVIDAALGAVRSIAQMGAGFITNQLTVNSLAQLLLFALAVLGIIHLWGRKQYIEGLAMIALIVATAVRGVWMFHGTQCVAVICLMAAFAADQIVEGFVKNKAPATSMLALAACIAVISINYFSGFKIPYLSVPKTLNGRALDAITDDGEPVWVTQICCNRFLIESKTSPYLGAAVPWFTDVMAQKIMDEYPEGPTRVIMHSDTNLVWGELDIRDYAPEVCAYVNENYTRVYENLYARNDYVEEAVRLMRQELPALFEPQDGE